VKVLVIGSGAREHALAWKLSQSPKVDAIFAAPGNAGTAQLGTNWSDIAVTAAPKLVAKATEAGIGLAVIGPEAALAAGVADSLRDAGIAVFGPGRVGARLESSKAFAKAFMTRHGIPTAKYKIVHDQKQAHRCLAEWEGGVVVKADGLAAGKGVVVCVSTAHALEVLEDWYGHQKVPGGGTSVVLEEALSGSEVSVMVVTDGIRSAELPTACDYKRAGDGDTGPNTGGMGSYSPTPDVLDDATAARIREDVLAPTLSGLRAQGIDYRGCLYAGIMLTQRGPMVLEYNARFGDPETQVVLPRMESDLFELLFEVAGASDGSVAQARPLHVTFSPQVCVGVVLASEGYPVKSMPLSHLPLPQAILDRDTVAFWGGSTLSGEIVDASGGRVLTICGLGVDHAQARTRAYAACAAYGRSLPAGKKLCCRSDIAARVGGERH
jgi:phosphoribosylamine---glycine ligase